MRNIKIRLSMIGILLVLGASVMAQDLFELPDTSFGLGSTNGIAWVDYNDDGFTDMYISNGSNGALSNKNYLYLNDGDGTFTKQDDAVGTITSHDYISGGCSWGDFDRDGDPDMIVAHPFTHGSLFINYSEVMIYSNNGDGTFTQIDAGDLSTEETISKSIAAFVDYTNDGWIDAFVSQANFIGLPANNHAIYSNEQDGTFTERTPAVTSGTSARSGFSWADFDEDGDMDVVTAGGALPQASVLWTNTGSDFTSTTLQTDHTTEAASWMDFDNDGDLDLLLINSGDTQDKPEANAVFLNDNGTLVEITSELGAIITDLDLSLGCAWGDYDNDGDLDVIIGNSGTDVDGHHSRLYMNNGNGSFSENTAVTLRDYATFSYAVAHADVDNDGDLDVMIGRDGRNQFYRNKTVGMLSDANWLQVNLTGVQANTSAIGAIVKIKATINSVSYWQSRDVNSQSGLGGHNDYRLHFGLGDATVVDSMIIRWPGSGLVEKFANIAPNQILDITEGTASAINQQGGQSVKGYALAQNYPNPFNPQTQIRFNLAAAGNVRVDVFSISGKTIKVLLDEFRPAGEHVVTFDGSRLPSGIYFYRLRSNNFEQIQKMTILK